MKVYVEAQSKAALIRRLAAGEEITGLNYSMFGGGGYYKLDNTLEDGTIIAIYSQMSGGNPVAKSWGTWTNGVLKAETFSLTDVKVCVISLVTSLDKLLNEADIVLNELFMLSFKLLRSSVLSLGSSLFLR